jgi:hypothetical protein
VQDILMRWRAAIGLVLFAAALRAWDLGHPVVHVDEQWYMLVADRLLTGATPYLDIWDRKPLGLFLLFAGVRWLGGADVHGGVLAHWLAAGVSAAAPAQARPAGAAFDAA